MQTVADRGGGAHRTRSAATAALVGGLAVAATRGIGQLISGALLLPSASPFITVGNAAVDRTPTPVKDFAVARFGTNDKLVLLIGMAVVFPVR